MAGGLWRRGVKGRASRDSALDLGEASLQTIPRWLWAIVRLARPQQWIKNGLVFAALLFSGRLVDTVSVGLAALAFAAFCLASSGTYCLNDALDAREDRLHPRKRRRPVASGLVSGPQAGVIAAFLAGGGTVLGFAVNADLGLIVLLYLGISVLYSLTLKHTVLLDVMAVASGFVLRAAGGAVAIEVQMSLWFLVCVPLLSLLLAVAKRRHELVTVDDAVGHREVLSEYPPQLLDQLIAILSGGVIITYLLYAMDSANPYWLMLTSPPVVYGVFRYLYLVYRRSEGGSPEELLVSDLPLLIAVTVWALVTIGVIYGG